MGAVALVSSLSSTASQAGFNFLMEQFGGLDLATPLPSGFFVTSLQTFGQYDRDKNAGAAYNITSFTYVTPYTFMNSELAFSYTQTELYQYGPQDTNPGGGHRLDNVSPNFGPTLSHSFGHGFAASLTSLVFAPDDILHFTTSAGFIAAFAYDTPTFNIDVNFTYSGSFGNHAGTPKTALAAAEAGGTAGVTGTSDGVGVDFTVKKRVGKFEFAAIGNANTEINTRLDDVGFNVVGLTPAGPVLQPYDKRFGNVSLGGLIGYDFGRFTIEGFATRDVARRFAYNGVQGLAGNAGYGEKETVGFLRLILPLYVAPRATTAPVVARF